MKTQPLNTSWQRYKELELVPDSTFAPQARFEIALPFVFIWRSLLNALAREQFYEHRTEYLERCWALSCVEPSAPEAKPLQKLWLLMDLV